MKTTPLFFNNYNENEKDRIHLLKQSVGYYSKNNANSEQDQLF